MRAISLSASLLLAACGGGSSGSSSSSSGDIEGLVTPSSMSILTAQNEASPRVAALPTNFRAAANALAASYDSAGTDYSTDEVHAYVWDESMESLQTINEILCYMDQTRASAMVNAGAYIALINEDKCRQGENQSNAGDSGQSSGGQSASYAAWVINSTRASNTAPQLVSIWVPGEEGGDARDGQTILVEMTITEGVSDSKPFGSFSLNFMGVFDASGDGGAAEEVLMKGTLRTVDNSDGKVQFQFVNLGGAAINSDLAGMGLDFSQTEASTVIMDDADGSSGVAVTHFSREDSHSGAEAATYALNFNLSHMLRGKDNDDDDVLDVTMCASRTDFDTNVWRYNLYHQTDGSFNNHSVSAGERVALNSGFPFTYNNKHGHVGYWGIWYEGGTPVPDGATINKVNHADNSSTPYTLHIAPGKLIRRQANTETLTSLRGEQFNFWGEHTSLGQGQYAVTINNSNEFVITDSIEWGDSGPVLTDVADDVITPSADGENLWLWSDSLGGNIVYAHDTSIAANDRTLTFYAESFVAPDDSTLFSGGSSITLYCYDRCLKGGLTQGDIDGFASQQDLYYATNPAGYAYSAEVSGGKLLLKDHNAHVVSMQGIDASSLGNDWGANTGEMVVTALGGGNWWDIYNQAQSYRWETGNNDWNKMVSVESDGDFVSFDRPINMSYTHSTANDANDDASHDGKKFLLQYGGNGELWGFPWVQSGNRWHSAVTLADGTVLTDGTNNFVVKAIELEQSLQADPGQCGSLDVDSLIGDPDLALPDASDIGTVSITLAGKPVITEAPAVIEGELQ